MSLIYSNQLGRMGESITKFVSIVSGASAMDDKAFAPNPMNIKIGDIVTWKNTDVETHTVTSGSSASGSDNVSEFDSGLIDPGQSFEHKFEKAGRYRYSCMIHPSMNGEIIVE
jgi:aldose sugar dehydrogenase